MDLFYVERYVSTHRAFLLKDFSTVERFCFVLYRMFCGASYQFM